MNAKWYVLIVISSLFIIKQANGQYLSVRGDFEVDQQLGCFDLTVTATNINPGTSTIIYQFDGYDSTPTPNPVYTYTEPGTYWINQYIQGATGEKKDSILVTVVEPQAPQVELQSCNNLELLVQINDNYYDEYEINYGDGTIITVPAGNTIPPYTYATNTTKTVSITGIFTTATNQCGVTNILFDPTATVLPAQLDSLIMLSNSSLKLNYILPENSINKLEVSVSDNLNFTLFKNLNQKSVVDTLINLNLSQNVYCFRIATYDACSNFRSYSNELCSIILNASAQNNQITSDWSTVDFGVTQTTSLFRDGSLFQSPSSSTFQHIDTTVICNTSYCYQLEINNSGGISRSLEACQTSFSTDIPSSIDNISNITYTDSIDWTWPVPLNFTPSYYFVHQALEDGTLLGKDSVSTNNYTEVFEQNVAYIAIQVVDICDNTSPLTILGSSILLEANINNNLATELVWNNYFGWVDGHQGYYITLTNNEGVLIDSIYTGGNTSFTLELVDQEDQTITYAVWVIPVLDGIKPSRSNTITVERDPVITIPNAFTPNGDGLNDKFIITGRFIEEYEMQIFSRWGEVLFQTADLENGWDGTSNNEKLSVGNYTYWVRVKDLNNKEHIRTGSILILSN